MRIRLGDKTLDSRRHRILLLTAGCSHVSDKMLKVLNAQQTEFNRLTKPYQKEWRDRDRLAKEVVRGDQFTELFQDQVSRYAATEIKGENRWSSLGM